LKAWPCDAPAFTSKKEKEAMLDASLYTRALNLAIENGRSAVAHHDDEQASAFVAQFCTILDYCTRQGLALGTYSLAGAFRLKRSGLTPSALHILIDGRDGWASRALPNRRARQYAWTCPMLTPNDARAVAALRTLLREAHSNGVHRADEPCERAAPEAPTGSFWNGRQMLRDTPLVECPQSERESWGR